MKRIHLLLFMTVLCCTLVSVSITASARGRGPRELQEVEEVPFPETVEGKADAAGFVIAYPESPTSFHTAFQTAVLEIGYKNVNRISDGKKELSIPRGIVITWKNDLAGDASYVIEVGTQEDLSDAVQYFVTEPANENGVYNYPIRNLYLNTACIQRFPDTDYVQALVNKETKTLALLPCTEGTRDSFPWCKRSKGKRTPKQITCKLFFAMIVDMMGWNPDFRYKLLGSKSSSV